MNGAGQAQHIFVFAFSLPLLHGKLPYMRYGTGIIRAVLAAFFLLAGSTVLRAENIPVDLELVFAVDVSLSMDQDEQLLQLGGYIAAFQHPDVIKAIRSGLYSRIAARFVRPEPWVDCPVGENSGTSGWIMSRSSNMPGWHGYIISLI